MGVVVSYREGARHAREIRVIAGAERLQLSSICAAAQVACQPVDPERTVHRVQLTWSISCTSAGARRAGGRRVVGVGAGEKRG